jgi:release factor glutamine methyltransferase
MYALDISSNALRVAKKNIKRHDLEKSINVVKSNFLSSFDDLELDSKKPLVIAANLPYIRNKDYGNMSSSTIEYEPDLALYGGINT